LHSQGSTQLLPSACQIVRIHVRYLTSRERDDTRTFRWVCVPHESGAARWRVGARPIRDTFLGPKLRWCSSFSYLSTGIVLISTRPCRLLETLRWNVSTASPATAAVVLVLSSRSSRLLTWIRSNESSASTGVLALISPGLE